LTSGIASALPPRVAEALPQDALTALDPQALVSPEATNALEAQFAVLPDGARLFAELMGALRLALATSVHDVFLVAAIVACGGVVVALFLPEKPLRGRQEASALVEAGMELAVEGPGTAPPISAANEPRLYVADDHEIADKHALAKLPAVRGPTRHR
jgi:hypothetical protein